MWLAIVCVVAVIALVMWAGMTAKAKSVDKRPSGSDQAAGVVHKAFMTDSEVEFWQLLRKAAAPLNVGPQVAMSALITATGGATPSSRSTARNSFDRKCVDFVLFDDSAAVLLIVELDDSTHVAEKDRKRDEQTAGAGYSTLRVFRHEAKTAEILAGLIAAKLPAPLLNASQFSSRAASRAK